MSATVPTPPATAPWAYPAEVLEYAKQQGVDAYLEPLREATQRLFPTGQLRVVLHRDPELRDVTFIVYEMHVRIADAPDRERVHLQGTLRTVTLRPRGGVPALEAELFDGSGVILLVWLGRRRITGISPGRSIAVEGRIGVHDKHRVMFNPRYELKHPS